MKRNAPDLKSEAAIKRWTFDRLAADDREKALREEASGESLNTRTEIAREAHPIHSAFVQRTVSIGRVRRQILEAIKNKDARAFARLTKNDAAREWAIGQLWRPSGHEPGTPKRGQRFITPDEREMLDHLGDVRQRVINLWEENGIRGQKRYLLTPEMMAVEYLIGPQKDWTPVPAEIWPGDPKDRPRSWRQRRDELIALLENSLKNKRIKPRRRKARL